MLPGSQDAPFLWGLCLFFAAAIAISIGTGRTLSGRWTIVRRAEQPGLFWVSIGALGVLLFASVFAALMAIAHWPPGARGWAAPNINPNTSLSQPRP